MEDEKVYLISSLGGVTRPHSTEVAMKTIYALSIVLSTLLVSFSNVSAQTQAATENEVTFEQWNLGGPRLGVTYIPGNGTLRQALHDKQIGAGLSQFGWQFEYLVFPQGGGPSFVVQFVPLVAGVEYGTLIPSASLALGVRMPNGIEFGLGPNLLIGGNKGVNTALVMAVGKSFNYGGVSIPLDLVVATNPDGNRISLVFGYAIRKAGQQ